MTIEPQEYGCFKNCMLYPYRNLKDVSTIAVMREFYQRNFDYLVIWGWFECAIIISKEPQYLNVNSKNTITMSEFKSLIKSLSFFRSIKESIRNGLYEKSESDSPDRSMYLLTSEHPVIKAIATNDHHYGNEWHGKNSIILGERYGDTTLFAVVAICMPSDYPLS